MWSGRGVCLRESESILRKILKANADSAGRNNSLRIWIRPAWASVPPAGEVWGGMRAGFGLGVFGKAGALRKEWKADIILLQVIKCITSLSIRYSILCSQEAKT